ncbi:hypothetical protein [Methanolobus sp.]|uniref:hypothetical protein n=1 Tax=Methanolobus sp. TaxID=1874737 RepID=UPI0025FA3D17|nr:hypothetical protein [Methanolobus sp.]
MERAGICPICGSVSHLNTCAICGRLVCNRCYDHSRSVCIQCASGGAFFETSSERTGLV